MSNKPPPYPHVKPKSDTLIRARHLRASMTEAEMLLWADLKPLRRQNLAFRRQAPIGPFVVDFLCRKAKLIVEVDGNHHVEDDRQWSHDRERDAWLKDCGYRILRFWNSDVLRDVTACVEQIYAEAMSGRD